MGIMRGRPHFVQGVVAKGGRSPEMKTLVSHHPQVTIFSDFLSLIAKELNTSSRGDKFEHARNY